MTGSRVRKIGRPSPTRSLALPSFLQQDSLDQSQFQLTHCTAPLPHPPPPVCSAYPLNVHLPRRRERHRYRVDPQRPTSLPFTCCPACLPCHSWPCEPAAPICSLTLAFSSSQSSQNIIFHLSALPQSWPTIHAAPVTMQAAPTKKRRRSTDDDAEGQSEPVDKVCEIDTLKMLISDSLTSNSESTSHPGLILQLGLSMATSGFLQQPVSVLPLPAEQV
jgi:hypothetical protein